jgi:N-acetylglucosaminyl-diphospho-decaprenol L-rhamnosyltransferase
MMPLSVVIVTYNTAHVLTETFSALRLAAEGFKLNCIVVDNASRDDSAKIVRTQFPEARLIRNRVNVGFGRAHNLALPFLEGNYVLLLNPDAFVSPDTLLKTITYMDSEPRCGILGVKLVDRNGVLQPSARYFPTPWNLFLARTGLKRFFNSVRMVDDMAWDHASVRRCDWVPGSYYLVRKKVIEEVGLFDPRFFLYYEEVDHCLAAKRAGWEVVFYPDTKVVHIGGESARSEGEITTTGRQLEAPQVESELLYFRKNHGVTGVWLNVVLTTLGDVMIALKRVLKTRSVAAVGGPAKHVMLLWSLFLRTDGGTHPTR